MAAIIPIETLVYGFITDLVLAAPLGSELHNLEVHDTIWRRIETDNGVRIGDCDSTLALNPEGEIEEYESKLDLIIYSRVRDNGVPDRNEARKNILRIAAGIAKAIQLDDSLGGRVCRTRLLAGNRGFDAEDSKPFAVLVVPLIINEM